MGFLTMRAQTDKLEVPLGHNKLNSMVKTMMSEAGVEGYYTNHSLRATAVIRLFQNDVDDKLIKRVTGH